MPRDQCQLTLENQVAERFGTQFVKHGPRFDASDCFKLYTFDQIMNQFLTEALVLSVIGGLLGIIVSLISIYLIHVLTDLQPVITIPIMVVATGVAGPAKNESGSPHCGALWGSC